MGKNDYSNGKNVIRAAEKAGCEVRRGKGDHVVVYSPKHDQMMVVPDREMGYGLECKIVKWMKLVGIITLLVIVYLFVNFPQLFNQEYTMWKMEFDTGVRPENRLDKNGKLNLGEWEVLRHGTIRIIYILESRPLPSYRLKYLAPASYLDKLEPHEVAIKIVEGGMLSEYAIFNR